VRMSDYFLFNDAISAVPFLYISVRCNSFWSSELGQYNLAGWYPAFRWNILPSSSVLKWLLPWRQRQRFPLNSSYPLTSLSSELGQYNLAGWYSAFRWNILPSSSVLKWLLPWRQRQRFPLNSSYPLTSLYNVIAWFEMSLDEFLHPKTSDLW